MAPIPQEDVLQRLQEFVTQLQSGGLLSGAQVQQELFRQVITSWPGPEPVEPEPIEVEPIGLGPVVIPQPVVILPITLGPIDVTGGRIKSIHVLPAGQAITADVLFSINGGTTLALRQGTLGQVVSAGRIFSLTLETVVTHIGVRLTPGLIPPSSVLVVVMGG